MNCVILQPSYIPWRGYFHQIHKADVFIFYDDVQYDKHGWRNRNRIKTANGPVWLTIPVHAKGAPVSGLMTKDVRVSADSNWHRKHCNAIDLAYSKAPFFQAYREWVRELITPPCEYLADFTMSTTVAIARKLGIQHTRFLKSSELAPEGSATDRLVHLLKQVGAKHYISGPSARNYLEEEKIKQAGLSLEYMLYDYAEYPQLYPPFDPQVSVLDLLFMTGPEAGKWIWGTPADGAGTESLYDGEASNDSFQ